ncbi:MAG TPA: hypothetical protein VJZ27_04210 [Aggregatilineales bacterium]|nr:hypothetical protein [Aggregatilineales bacterium]
MNIQLAVPEIHPLEFLRNTEMVKDTFSLEQNFCETYHRRHGAPVKQFETLENGFYVINGIQFSQTEVNLMLQTMQTELAEHHQGMVKRLIKFFGGKRLG